MNGEEAFSDAVTLDLVKSADDVAVQGRVLAVSYSMILNQYIRTSGLYDRVVDFDAATLDPTTGNMKAGCVPDSQFTQLPWDYLHPNHGGYAAMAQSIDVRPFAKK